MKYLIFILSIFLISNSVSAASLGDLKKVLENAEDKLKKELEIKSENSSEGKSLETQSDSTKKTTAQNNNNSDFINLPKSKFLTIEAFKRDFDKKILVLNRVSNGPNSTDIILKISINKFANGSNFEQAGIDTDVYYKENGKWLKEVLKLYYWEDAYFCDSMKRNTCVPGGMGFQMDAFDYIFGIMMGDAKSIGTTVTAKAGYKLIPTYAVQEGDRSFNPQEWRLISPNRFNDAEFSVIELSNDENIIAQLEAEIN